MSRIQVDDDGLNVDTISSQSIDDYLMHVANEKIQNIRNITELSKRYLAESQQLELEEIELNKDLQTVIKNRKTILKARLKEENISLNNLLAEAFPDSFSELKEPLPEPITTIDNPLQCMRLIGRYNSSTDSFDKINCLDIFETLDELNIHVSNHKLQGELI